MQGTSLTIQPDCFPLSGYGRVVCTLSSLCKMTTAPAFITPEVRPIEMISVTDNLEKLSMMGNEKLNWINSIQCFKGCNWVVISTEVWRQVAALIEISYNDLIAAPSHLGNGGNDGATPPNSLLHTLFLSWIIKVPRFLSLSTCYKTGQDRKVRWTLMKLPTRAATANQ